MKIGRERSTFAVAFAGTFALILGLISGIVTLLGTHFTPRTTCIYVLISAVAGVTIHWHRLRREQISPDIFSQVGEPLRRRICCPCTLALSKEVAALARSCFGSDTISLDRYEQLRVKNPYILACLLGARGPFIGYFDVVPLDEHFGTLFLSGRLGERDLTHEHVLAPDSMSICKFVYLSGIAAVDASSMAGMQNASILVWASLKYLDHFYGSTGCMAFASAVTSQGEHLLQRLGFNLQSEASVRSDHHSLYCIDLSRDVIRQRLRTMPDYGGLVELPWNTPQSVPIVLPRSPRGISSRTRNGWAATGTESTLRRVK